MIDNVVEQIAWVKVYAVSYQPRRVIIPRQIRLLQQNRQTPIT